jgi:mannose-6-phosphate isomerase-like protein (cupin superfamily)
MYGDAKGRHNMNIGRHFDFESLEFERVIAHGGCAEIQFKRVVTAGAGGAYNFLDMSVVPPGSEIGKHTHSPDNEELYIVISGSGRMQLDTQEFDVGPGHVIINPPGGTHGLRNIGDTDLRLVVIEVSTR